MATQVSAKPPTDRIEGFLDQGLLQALFNSHVAGVAVLTPATRVLDANKHFCDLTGFSLDELRSMDWSALVHADDSQQMAEMAGQPVTRTGQESTLEQKLTCKDGALLWLQSSVSVIRDDQGMPVRLVAVCRDVTEMLRVKALVGRQAEALALSNIGAPLHDVLDVLVRSAQAHSEIAGRASFFLVDADGIHLRSSAGSIPESYKRSVDWFDIGPHSPSCGLAAHSGQAVIVRDVNADPLWAPYLSLAQEHGFRACWSFPLLSSENKVLGTLAFYHATPRVPSAEDLEFIEILCHTAAGLIARDQLEAELKKITSVKDDFIGLVAHELRSPVSTIFGNAMLLTDRGDRISDADTKQALRDIARESMRLNRALEDLVVLAQPERGGPPIEPLDVFRMSQRTVEEHKNDFPDRAVDIIQEGEHQLASGSADYIEQVLRNLISNAEKYSPSSAPIRIIVQSGAEIRVTVKDHGFGISPEDMAYIFQMFYRAPGSSEKATGMGIGLAVCQRLIAAQGGRIWVQPGEAGGSEFCFTLPLYSES